MVFLPLSGGAVVRISLLSPSLRGRHNTKRSRLAQPSVGLTSENSYTCELPRTPSRDCLKKAGKLLDRVSLVVQQVERRLLYPVWLTHGVAFGSSFGVFVQYRRSNFQKFGLPQTTRGVGAEASGGVSVCLVYLRDRCSGPFTTTTMAATAHHSATSSQPCLTQSAPENIAEK